MAGRNRHAEYEITPKHRDKDSGYSCGGGAAQRTHKAEARPGHLGLARRRPGWAPRPRKKGRRGVEPDLTATSAPAEASPSPCCSVPTVPTPGRSVCVQELRDTAVAQPATEMQGWDRGRVCAGHALHILPSTPPHADSAPRVVGWACGSLRDQTSKSPSSAGGWLAG